MDRKPSTGGVSISTKNRARADTQTAALLALMLSMYLDAEIFQHDYGEDNLPTRQLLAMQDGRSPGAGC